MNARSVSVRIPLLIRFPIPGPGQFREFVLARKELVVILLLISLVYPTFVDLPGSEVFARTAKKSAKKSASPSKSSKGRSSRSKSSSSKSKSSSKSSSKPKSSKSSRRTKSREEKRPTKSSKSSKGRAKAAPKASAKPVTKASAKAAPKAAPQPPEDEKPENDVKSEGEPPETPVVPAEETETVRKRDQSYGVHASAYKLYDEGVNARLVGNYGISTKRLEAALDALDGTTWYQKSGRPSTLQASIHFELGRTAEASGDMRLARDSYQRCLFIRPSFTPASVRLINLLALSGLLDMALSKARDAVRDNPTDPRAHLMLALILERRGEKSLAGRERSDARRLLDISVQPLPPEARKGEVVPLYTGEQKLPTNDMLDMEMEEKPSPSDSAPDDSESESEEN